MNIFESLSEKYYERPTSRTEMALYELVQDHIQEYEEDGNTDHAVSKMFKNLEREILLKWSDNVRSSIFGENKEEL